MTGFAWRGAVEGRFRNQGSFEGESRARMGRKLTVDWKVTGGTGLRWTGDVAERGVLAMQKWGGWQRAG